MNVNVITKFGKTAEKFASDNAPTILTTLGAIGTVATAYLTAKASFKSAKQIDDKNFVQKQHAEPVLTRKDEIKLVWSNFVPPVAAGVGTVGAIVMANQINAKRLAAMAAGYSLVDGRLEEYKAKMKDKFGAGKEQAARDDLAQDHVNKTPPDTTLIITEGKTMFRDEPSGRYFESTMEDIRRAENTLNTHIRKHEYAVLTDFYELIGLSPTSLSEEFGWDITNEQMEISYSTVITPQGKPCICLDYNVHPMRGGIPSGGGSAKTRAV